MQVQRHELVYMNWFKRQRVRYILRRHPIDFELWEKVLQENAVFKGLSSVDKAHLRELTTLLLHHKKFTGVQGLVLTVEMAVSVAALACLPILKLGLVYYDGWTEIIIYPGIFRVKREQINSDGLIVQQERMLSGEAWLRGPVILAWEEIKADLLNPQAGHSVVIHELSHKLDMLNGSANGMPPLHMNMERQDWTRALSHAFESLTRDLSHHRRSHINAYASTSPAEFFAVVSEYFFIAPDKLQHHYPTVYEQLALFYHQNPAKRFAEMLANE